MFEQKLITKLFDTQQLAVDFMYIFNINSKVWFSSVLNKHYINIKKEGNEKAIAFNINDYNNQ